MARTRRRAVALPAPGLRPERDGRRGGIEKNATSLVASAAARASNIGAASFVSVWLWLITAVIGSVERRRDGRRSRLGAR